MKNVKNIVCNNLYLLYIFFFTGIIYTLYQIEISLTISNLLYTVLKTLYSHFVDMHSVFKVVVSVVLSFAMLSRYLSHKAVWAWSRDWSSINCTAR